MGLMADGRGAGLVPDLNAGRRLPPSVAPLRVDNAADGGHYALV